MTTSGRLAITTLGYFDLEPRVLERLDNILDAGNQIVTNEQPLRHAGDRDWLAISALDVYSELAFSTLA